MNSSSHPRTKLSVLVLCVLGALAVYTPAAAAKGGGSATSATNTFSPPAYVDYHTLGGEPTTVVDRYPITSGTYHGQSCTTQSPCYPDIQYVSNPLGLGFPGYSEVYKSSDGGTTFRVPLHNPYFVNEPLGSGEGSGGGDSHLAIGQTTHSVFMVDLSGGCVTTNISRDFGETYSSNKLGCEANPGAIDDRPWVAADETGGLRNVYMNVNNDTGCLVTSDPGCSIVFVKSTDDGGANTPADFAASQCNDATMLLTPGVSGAATSCPDPTDPNFWIAGPVVADTSPSSPHQHDVYIPFERFDGTNYSLWIAKSTDQGSTWNQLEVANVGSHNPANIFPDLNVDSAGNLYYTWSQDSSPDSSPNAGGETDVYYTDSTNGGTSWATPVDLTKENGDSAVFPWVVAGSPGEVDLVYYKANTGLNPNVAGVDSSGNSCDPSSQAGCTPNTTRWNTYFVQSQNALNSGANFKSVQISPHPIHIGGVCTGGTSCNNSQYANRDLLDFFTVDVDHLGAADITWADDNNSYHDTRQFFSRQLSGSSVFANQNITAQNSWPTTSSSATDPAGDAYSAAGTAAGSCPGMDLLGDSVSASSTTLTMSLTLNSAPTSAEAVACSGATPAASGGLWGAEFWAASTPVANSGPFGGNDNFYIAYRDNPPDGAPGVEAGAVNAISATFTHDDFQKYESGTVGGTCTRAKPPSPCTLTMTASLAGLGIKAGAALDSTSGFSAYYFGSGQPAPGTRVPLGNSNLADAIAPFDLNGTGTTSN